MTSTTTTLNFPASASSFRRVNAVPGIRAFGSRPGLRRHKWTATELSDLSVAYIEQSCDAPLWKIAETLRDQFCENKHRECEDESTTTTTGYGYSAVPSIPAIILKLTDCVYLETNGAMSYLYVRRPTQLHADVWQHLQESRRHRAMIQSMKARAADADCVTFLSTMMMLTSSKKVTAAATKAKMQRSSSSSSSIGKVRGRVFIDDDGEIESECPPAKRCKYTDIDDNDDDASDDDGDAMMTPLPHVEESVSPTVFHFGSLADALSEIDTTEDCCDDDHYPSDDEMYDCERERAIQSANITTSALGHRLETLSFRMNELVAEIDAIRQTVSSSGGDVAPAEQCVLCAKCHKSIDCQREAWTAYWRNRHSDTDMGETTYECEKCRTPLSSAEQQQVDEETIVAVATTPIAAIAATAYQQLQPSHYQQQHVEWDYDYESGEENDYANYHDFIRGGENNTPPEEI